MKEENKMMKIYFSGSIYGGREKLTTYKQLIAELQKYGQVLNTEVASDSVIEDEKGTTEDDKRIFETLENKLKQADLIFAEWTIPSLGVGYEAGLADCLGKRVIGIYDETITPKITTMLRGNSRLKIISYKNIEDIIENIEEIIKD